MSTIEVDVDELVCFDCHMRDLEVEEDGDDIYFSCKRCNNITHRATILRGAVTNARR